ncbi:MAG: hypothetical protein L6N94_06545, partial [Candidatus Methylarchaceae archaeon HK01M]|nr:hypothetical protein [Candidatus Methylarchaceae archaeon HK01M]
VDKIDLIIWDIPIGEFERNVDGAILKNLQKIVPKDIQSYVSFELGWWPFPFLNVQYEKQGNVDCLNWFADIYIVASEEVRLSEGEHKLTIADQELPIILEGYSLGYYEIFLEPWQTDMKGIFLFSTPFNLFFGLVKGENEPDGCEIIKRSDKKITYRIDGFGDLVLSDNFIEFVKSLGESINKLKKLLEFGFIDQTTYEIIIEKMKPKPVKPIVKIRRKDKERLMRIAEVKEHMSNSWWGKLLGITKEGAWYFLNRFEKEKFLTLDKSKQGVKAELTELGKEALGLL